MQNGSIVQCINNDQYAHYIKPDLIKTYTIKSIIPKGSVIAQRGFAKIMASEDLLYLEEINNELITVMGVSFEPPYALKDFRELLPPMAIDLKAILEDELVAV